MNIGGLQKTSLIDYPGKISCILFLSGCNFDCPYCHNPDLVRGAKTKPAIDEQQLNHFLSKRKGLIDGVVITGGEPTLQSDLEELCQMIKSMGFVIKLDTNGSRPGVLKQLIADHLVDFVAMDIKTDTDHYPMVMKNPTQLNRVIESIAVIMKKAPAYEFRTTCARPFVSADIMENIGKMIRGAASYVLQSCSRNVDVLDPDFAAVDDHFLSVDDMEALKAAVLPFVENTRIR